VAVHGEVHRVCLQGPEVRGGDDGSRGSEEDIREVGAMLQPARSPTAAADAGQQQRYRIRRRTPWQSRCRMPEISCLSRGHEAQSESTFTRAAVTSLPT